MGRVFPDTQAPPGSSPLGPSAFSDVADSARGAVDLFGALPGGSSFPRPGEAQGLLVTWLRAGKAPHILQPGRRQVLCSLCSDNILLDLSRCTKTSFPEDLSRPPLQPQGLSKHRRAGVPSQGPEEGERRGVVGQEEGHCPCLCPEVSGTDQLPPMGCWGPWRSRVLAQERGILCPRPTHCWKPLDLTV